MAKCTHHHEAWLTYQVARRIEHNEAGWCVRCGYHVAALDGLTLCARHVEIDRHEAYLERERGKTDAERARRARYREAGLCPLCGEPPEGGILCPRHAAKARDDSQLHRDRTRGNG